MSKQSKQNTSNQLDRSSIITNIKRQVLLLIVSVCLNVLMCTIAITATPIGSLIVIVSVWFISGMIKSIDMNLDKLK